MAFPTNSDDTLASALTTALTTAAHIRATAQLARNRTAAGPVPARDVLRLLTSLRASRTALQAVANTPGIASYAQAQMGAGMDIANEFGAMFAALDAVLAHIVAALPRDPNGYLLIETLSAQGVLDDRDFTSAETATLRTLLDALIATIE